MDSEKVSSEISSLDQESIGASRLTPRLKTNKKILTPRSPSVVHMPNHHHSGMTISRSPTTKPRMGRKISRLSRVQKHDRAQDILDNVLLRITTLRDNPDVVLSDNLGALTSGFIEIDEEEEEDDEEDDDVGFDPYEEAARQIDEMQENACSQNELIAELKNELTLQRFESQSELQKLRLEVEQHQLSNKIRVEEMEAQESKISKLKVAFSVAEEKLEEVKLDNAELREEMQKFKLETKSLHDRLRISERDKNHVEALCKNTADMMEIELAALREKLKSLMTRLNQEEELCNTLRSELKTKSLDVEWLKTEKKNLKSQIDDLQTQLKSSKKEEKELDDLRDQNRKLRLEIEELESTTESLTQRLEMKKQLTQDMEKRLLVQRARREQASQSKVLTKYESMDQKLKIERLEIQVQKLKEDLDLGEKKISELNGRLQASEENVMKSRLERDEVIMAMKREQTSMQFAVEASKNTSIREYERKLQHANSATSILEAKLSALKTQLTVLENSNVKALNIQKSTIANLERELADSRAQLRKATDAQREQNELATALEMERRKFEEEQFGLKMRLKVVDSELEQNATLHVDVKSLQEKLKTLDSQNSRVELEKSQLEIKLQSMEERVALVQEQRVQSLGIQRETIILLEEELKSTRSQYHTVKGKKVALDAKVKLLEGVIASLKKQIQYLELKISTRSTEIANLPDLTKLKEPTSVKPPEVKYYEEMLESEKQISTRLAARVKDLTQKNKKGGKALTILLKGKKQLEERLKMMNKLRQHMSKIEQRFVWALERELKRFEQRKEQELSPEERNQIDSELSKLRTRLEAERKILHELSTVGSPKAPVRLKSGLGLERFKIQRAASTINLPVDHGQRVKELLKKLDVTNDVSRLKHSFEELRNQEFNDPQEWHRQVQSLKDELYQIAERTRSGRNEVCSSLEKYTLKKLELSETLQLLKDWAASYEVDSRLKSRINNELEEKPSTNLNFRDKTKLSKELELRTHIHEEEVSFIERQIVQIEAAIQRLTKMNADALNGLSNLSSLISSSENLWRMGGQEVWHLPVAYGHQYKKSSWERHTHQKKMKAHCTHCKARNTVDNFSTSSKFQVNCWRCNKFFQVEQNKDLSSPRSVNTDVAAFNAPLPIESSWGKPKLTRALSSPALMTHSPKLSKSIGGAHPETPTGSFDTIKVSGLPVSMVKTPQLLDVFCNVVFCDHEIAAKKTSSAGDLEVGLTSAVTSKEISELQSKLLSLREAMRSKPHYDGDIDKVTLKGISSEQRSSQANVGALTSPSVLKVPSVHQVSTISSISFNANKQHGIQYV